VIDSHAHLDFPQFDGDREEVIARAGEAGVKTIINVGADLVSSQRSVDLADRHPSIYASVGIHPHDALALDDSVLERLRDMARHPRVVGIGEIGLDYYRDLSPRDMQLEAFERQLDLADELELPFIVHDRDAHDAIMSTLERRAAGREALRGVLHCFSGDETMARKALELGLYVSVAGPVTFHNARRLPDVVQEVPLSRLLLETDCPYLAPHPHRGKRNEPAYVLLVAERVAALKGVSVAEVEKTASDNARDLFGLHINETDGRKDIASNSRS
jgi:TatD DNase family protein